MYSSFESRQQAAEVDLLGWPDGFGLDAVAVLDRAGVQGSVDLVKVRCCV
jgi:hypothetical protein